MNRYKTKEEAPEELREFLKETEIDGVKWFTVAVVPKAKLDQFRDNNTALSKAATVAAERIAKLAGLIPEGKTDDDLLAEVVELRKTAQLVKDGKLKVSADVENEIATRTGAMRTSHDETVQGLTREVNKWKDTAGTYDSRYRQTILDNAVMAAASDPKLGVNPAAMAHVVQAARGVFSVGEKNVMLAKDNGGNTIWGEDGSTPMSITEWLKKLRQTDEFFFLGSKGGGAAGGGMADHKYGVSAAELSKMTPHERLKIANRTASK